MKLGCSSSSYDTAFREGRIDLPAWLRLCAQELEVDGVELVDAHFPTTDPVYLRDIKKLCTDLHLTIAGVAVTNDFGPDDRRALETANVRRWCDVAAYLGAPIVRVFAGWVPAQPLEQDDGRIIGALRRVFGRPKSDARRIWSDAMASLRACADYAADRGVVLALQNSRSDGLVASSQQLAQCVHDVGSPWLRICLDPADLADRTGIETSAARVVQVHARMRNLRDDGSDAYVHWPELLQLLKLARYRGFVLVDYDGAEECETAAPRATRYLRGLLILLARQQLLSEVAPLTESPASAIDGWRAQSSATSKITAGTTNGDAREPEALVTS